MARTKNIHIQSKLLIKLHELLSARFLQSDKALSSDLKQFVSELDDLGPLKQYAQGRATKISVAITVYYSINGFKLESEVIELLNLFKDNTESKIATIFSECATKILTALHSYSSREYMGAEIYFVDDKGIKELLAIKKHLESHYAVESDKRPYGLGKLVNLLNDSEICFKYTLFNTPRFKQINRVDSVIKYQPQHYAVWKSTLIKQNEEFINLHKPDDKTKERLMHALEAKLTAAKAEDEYMDKNRDNLEIRIIEYKKAELRPVIKITTLKHTNDKHLRSEVPNVLWFKPEPFRSDMDADEFVKNAQNPYGSVYYIAKK